MKELPLNKVYRLIEPGPLVFLTTELDGKFGIMTMTYLMMADDLTPLIAVSLGPWDHSYAAFRTTKQCVIAIPAADFAVTAVEIGNCSGGNLDKFRKFHLTPLKAETVNAPLIKECIANIECVIEDDSLADRFNLFILRVTKAWVDKTRPEQRTIHHKGDGTFFIDGETLDLRKYMTKWPDFVNR